MASLELGSLTKAFGDGDERVVAVDDLSLAVDDGEFFVVVGPSGSGKSTTLRMVAGLEDPTGGEVRLDGIDVTGDKPRLRDVAMAFQSDALYPHMTVRENLAFGLEQSTDLPDEEIAERVADAAELLGIDELLDRSPDELSGGQRQRVALGRAVVREPAVFLLDEPLCSLDPALRSRLRRELQRIQAELGVTTVYVTHDRTDAMTMGDRVAVLEDGELQQVGTPLECYHAPANRFVAGFLGDPAMNFVDVTNDGGTLVADDLEYPLGEAVAESVTGRDELVLGVRPESLELTDRRDPTDAHDVEATVDVVEPTGNETVVYLDAREWPGDRTLVATTDGTPRIGVGDAVVARIPEHAIHLFDRANGRALRNRSRDDRAGPP